MILLLRPICDIKLRMENHVNVRGSLHSLGMYANVWECYHHLCILTWFTNHFVPIAFVTFEHTSPI